MPEIIDKLISELRSTSFLEWISTLSQVVSVYCARINHIAVYPTGIIGVLIACWMYFFLASPPLYAEGVLNFYYFIMSVYGWYQWSLKDEQKKLARPITHVSNKQWMNGGGIFVGFYVVILLILMYWTDSNTPHMDAFVTASAFVAMYWMALRKIENWLAWILSNMVAVPLNYSKGFILFSLMFIVFLIMAIWGYITWYRSLHQHVGDKV